MKRYRCLSCRSSYFLVIRGEAWHCPQCASNRLAVYCGPRGWLDAVLYWLAHPVSETRTWWRLRSREDVRTRSEERTL